MIATGLRLCFEDHVERRLAPRNQIPSMSNVSIVRPCSSYQQVVLGNVPDGATARARGQRARAIALLSALGFSLEERQLVAYVLGLGLLAIALETV